MTRRTLRRQPQPRAATLIIILIALAIAGYLWYTERDVSPTAQQPPVLVRTSELAPISYTQLPPEARETLALITSAGPFPYEKDGSIFQNRERLLPGQPRGYYREYTVITPGSEDRGARRIVAGQGGERFYTADHYASFREIVP
jgi:ribonuclease T1